MAGPTHTHPIFNLLMWLPGIECLLSSTLGETYSLCFGIVSHTKPLHADDQHYAGMRGTTNRKCLSTHFCHGAD